MLLAAGIGIVTLGFALRGAEIPNRLADAFQALGTHGTVHLYGILGAAEEGEKREKIESAARAAGVRVKNLSLRHVRAYSPAKYHTAFDVTVARA